jgi:TetR/AcrR family transcriptional repressor of bet genes
VEKVVAIAKMSPGIVRFYFESKAAMLVASLQFLAAEFEEKVLMPVAKLKATPTIALRSLVELYFDPQIASTRKVSVWYAFWGEASSRQEYYDICGQKDESFALLVRELIEALIAESSQVHLDADAIALGLIGALEILWQEIAFQSERDLDRDGYRRRGMAFLSSIFPGSFGAGTVRVDVPSVHTPRRLAGWAYCDAGIFALERDRLLRGAWMVVGHESQLARVGEYLTLDIGVERVLIVRDAAGALHGLRNSCPQSPHAVVAAPRGRFDHAIECRQHGRSFALDGHDSGAPDSVGMLALDLRSAGGLIFVRSPSAAPHALDVDAAGILDLPPGTMLIDRPVDVTVAADWKVVAELWLETVPLETRLETRSGAAPLLRWSEPLGRYSGWSTNRYPRLVGCLPATTWHRYFLAPNQLIERRPDGLSVLQVLATAPGRCLLRRFDCTVLAPDAGAARAAQYLARRIGAHMRQATVAMAESIQTGRLQFGYELATAGSLAPGIAWFRDYLVARVPALASDRPP